MAVANRPVNPVNFEISKATLMRSVSTSRIYNLLGNISILFDVHTDS